MVARPTTSPTVSGRDAAAGARYPVMILAMENAALARRLKPFFAPGERGRDARGRSQHLAATPVGRTVTAHAEVLRVDARLVTFAVSARRRMHEIGRGTHERAVIDLAKFVARLG